MKKVLLATIALTAMMASIQPAQAEEIAAAAPSSTWGNIGGTVGFTTDYRFRGVTQTSENPAIQGSFDWSHDSGLYAGVWGSNVDFGDANLETDVYGGYKFPIAGLNLDVGVVGYLYPGADDSNDYDYWEGKLAVNKDFGFVNATATAYYSPDFFGSSGDAVYANLGLVAPIMDTGFTLQGAAGHQWIDDETKFGLPDYSDWSLGVGYNWNGFDLALKYVDTDLETSECPDGCDATGLFTVTKTFN